MAEKVYWPELLVVVWSGVEVWALRSVTTAPGTTDWSGSLMVPLTWLDCAKACRDPTRRNRAQREKRRRVGRGTDGRTAAQECIALLESE
jgi:hypothetical protein